MKTSFRIIHPKYLSNNLYIIYPEASIVDGNGRPKTRKNHALETIPETKKNEPTGTMEGKRWSREEGGGV